MTRDDNNLIWDAIVNEGKNPDAGTYAAQAKEPALEVSLDRDEEEEGPTSNLDNLISQAAAEDNQSDIRRSPGSGETAAQFNALKDTEF